MSKILVALKRVVDYNAKILLKNDKTGIDLAKSRMIINPFCEIALEAAVRQKEKGMCDEVLVATVGDISAEQQLRQAMARGADKGILVQTEPEQQLEPLQVAQCLAGLVKHVQPSMVLAGKQAVDSDTHQTPQLLAALLDWPQSVATSHIELTHHENGAGLSHARVAREVDSGLEQLHVPLPAVISADLRLCTPRSPSLKHMMQAKRKVIEKYPWDTWGGLQEHMLNTVSVAYPPQRAPVQMVSSVQELVDKIREHSKVI